MVNFDTDASNETYLKEIQEKEKRIFSQKREKRNMKQSEIKNMKAGSPSNGPIPNPLFPVHRGPNIYVSQTGNRPFYNRNFSTIFCRFWRLLKRLKTKERKKKKKMKKTKQKKRRVWENQKEKKKEKSRKKEERNKWKKTSVFFLKKETEKKTQNKKRSRSALRRRTCLPSPQK